MANGELTARVARELSRRIPYSGFDVLFDHGNTSIDPPDRVGNISSWFGKQYSSKSQLALLDIAVVDRNDDRAIILVEIEESSSNPKVVISDAFGTLFGDHITFQGKRPLYVGDFTTLVVLLNDDNPDHLERLLFLQEKIIASISRENTGNSAIRQIKFDIFQNEEDLVDKLFALVKGCLAKYIDTSK